MKPLRIEFGDAPPAMPWWTMLLFAVALAACAHGLWRVSSAQADIGELQRLVDQRNDLRQLRTPPPRDVRAVEVPVERARAVARAVERLNAPWPGLFAAVAKGKPDTVALLALEPDLAKGMVKITAETREAAEMLRFAEDLARQDAFASASLAKHEVSDRDPLKPYRFQIEAQWRVRP